MEKKAGEVYRIIRNKTGKCYVGQTTRTAAERFEEHRRCKTSYIGRAIRHYGVKAFTLEVLEVCETLEQLKERERYFIAKFDCRWPKGYNMTDGGEGIWDRTPESIKKMSRKGMHHTEATRQLIKISSTDRHPDENTKQKISQAQPNRRAVVCVETNEVFETMTAAAQCKQITLPSISRACNNPSRRAGGYHWTFRDEPTTEKPASSPKKRPVICVETGETFESIRAAAKHCNIDRQCISSACKDSLKIAAGFHWQFANVSDEPAEIQPRKQTTVSTKTTKPRSVICVETGEVFESIIAAGRHNNISHHCIARACNCPAFTSCGFHWRYKDEPTT